MKSALFTFVLLLFMLQSFGQLATKRDYDLSLSLDVGANVCVALPSGSPAISPQLALGITAPFNRRWFLGADITYSSPTYKLKDITVDMKTLALPVYIKMMLPSNKSIILLGGFLAHNTGSNAKSDISATDIKEWNSGAVLGFRQDFTKQLSASLKMQAAFNTFLKDSTSGKAYRPFGLALTLSYTFLRLNDCGCD
ncbi:MAG: hypothetical protein LBM07_06945 [Culturomica sp.]|jgi:hypothetical protein|nr:hypothetical protein [Culturomica sp.]